MGLLDSLKGGSPARPAVPRKHERYQTSGLSCPLGELLDLSQSGMRIGCEKRPAVKPGDVVPLSIRSASQQLSVSGRVMWMRRKSWRAFHVGFQFIDVRPGVGDALVQFARHGFIEYDGASTTKRSATIVEVEDLYAILGVPGDASAEQIHNAYRKAARQYHPDTSPDPEAQDKFTRIGKAYSVLRDETSRKKYDVLFARGAA